MLSVLTALGGLLGSFLPELIKLFKDRADKAHELKIMELQISAQKELGTQRIEEVKVQADIAESNAVYQFANPKSGWAEAVNSMVRPVITMFFVVGYLYSKWPHVAWTDTDQALLSGILGFWFGSRSIRHFLGDSTKVSSAFPFSNSKTK